ncbi:MAG: MotA/TolQ/ExbB proton channel family protein, partial [Blautia sp.]|nr:MotA/TolQ/ExbB proton channel family protein [Blautia sp.]
MGRKFSNLLFFILVTGGALVLTWYVGQGQPSIVLYNLIFLGIMAFVYLIGMFGGMYQLDSLSKSLRYASEELRDIFQRPGKADMNNLQLLNGIFRNRYLDRKLENFTSSISNTVEGIGELEDYINEEEIDIHVHKRLLELVPDVFTSLGILGTFVGLVWGLKDFNPSDYGTMTTSVSSLLDGIKVAFLTSIYGISFSIVFTVGMRTCYSAMSESLTGFLERFHAYVLPTAENESRNLLVASQRIQTDAMKQMTAQFSSQLADSFEKVITPTFQKMNGSLDMLVANVTTAQEDAIRQILGEFLRQMNMSFKLEFNDFNAALSHMTKALRDNTDYTSALYQSLSQELTSSYQSQERAMGSLLTQLEASQQSFVQASGEVMRENQAISAASQQEYQRVVDYLRESEKSAAKFWVACNQAMQKYLDAAASSMDKAAQTGKLSEDLVRANQEISQTFAESMKDYAHYQAL